MTFSWPKCVSAGYQLVIEHPLSSVILTWREVLLGQGLLQQRRDPSLPDHESVVRFAVAAGLLATRPI